MKMKLLDCTLVSLLAGLPALAMAQQAVAEPESKNDLDQDCDDDECENGKRRANVVSDPGPHPDLEQSQPAGKHSLALPGGGIVWATEDPNLGLPELSASAPTLLSFDGVRIVKPVQFYVRSNYPAFAERFEVVVYRGTDGDLVEPLATFPIPVSAVADAEWNGELPSGSRFRAGDELVYVLRAYDGEGHFDETYPQRMQLVTPEEAERGAQLLRDSTQKQLGTSLTTDEAQAQSLLQNAFSGNGLRQQNIPVYGSRIRVQGRNLPAGYTLAINGDDYPVDMERKFVAEFLMPVGKHAFDVELKGGRAGEPLRQSLDIDVTGRYFFAVAMADVTIAQNSISGSKATFLDDPRHDDSVISDGRLAFYLKSKLKGRYLVTAQADTTERDLKKLFNGFTQADPQDIFRRLDPDLYYPTYGDDSSVYRDVDTMGRFYLRLDWDKSQALWGNYSVGLTGTQYAQYVRSLYGAAVNWRSQASNTWGDAVSEVRAFGSQAETSPGHSEFIGTGGSLYYLRHADLLPGSDIVTLEIRDTTTGRVENRVQLQRGTDYEIDELQGRILLSRPLAQITRENLPTIVRDTPMSGYEQRLIADYEWVPSGFDSDDVTMGVRGKHWVNDHLAIGATYVDENRAGEDYTLYGTDITLQAGKGTYLKMEYSKTESTSSPVFFSDNGGFTFTRINPEGPREGHAKAAEGRINFKELGLTQQEWSAGGWWRRVDSGYSISRYDTGEDITEYGAEVQGKISEDLSVYARHSRAERGAEALEQSQLSGEWRIGDFSSLTGEIRRVRETRSSGDVAGTLGAVRYSRRLGTSLDLYGIAQFTLDDDNGAYASNDAYTLGGKYLFGDLSSIGAEATHGDRGDSAQVNAEYRLTPEHTTYGSYNFSTDDNGYDALFNPTRQSGWTLGQRWRLSSKANLFNESQYLKNPNESGLAHTFGMDFYPAQGFNTGFTLQQGELVNSAGGEVHRKAISLSGGVTHPNSNWQSKVEWRRDTGAEQREQWVSTNTLTHRIDDDWRIAARLNYSDTSDKLDSAAGARFIEGNVGFAYRPVDSQRWGVFGRYTYMYDLSTLGQVNGTDYDQRSQIVSLEGVYKLDQRWETALKVARREGQARLGRGTGAWFDSATTFVAGQIRYDIAQKWHALAEHRWLDVKDGGTKKGWLVGLDRDISQNFRVGVGYNLTDFSDDLTRFDYTHKGWFINMVGSY